jgi:hypothetical protein
MRALVEFRDKWLNPPGIDFNELKNRTLTNLYNQRPEWLSNAHHILDEAADAIKDFQKGSFGKPFGATEESSSAVHRYSREG